MRKWIVSEGFWSLVRELKAVIGKIFAWVVIGIIATITIFIFYSIFALWKLNRDVEKRAVESKRRYDEEIKNFRKEE